ncbi:Phosphorylated carbohydrates phosphatase [Bacillus sp. T2.9-1]|uniref:HAD family hydrolase n=1 Tax=Bacillus sp. T2.9-1 TaxID=3041163 RepID=UPI002477A0C3|nr:HAD family phosphatase [Bacillus sp. T2.9-1]CAI9395182.1 Phosphorylated carbohydrates phosphatase [Bacillus sp. T2.9-1]
MGVPSLVIFDMDGLMFDTEKLAYQAWQMTADHYGFSFERALFEQFIGITNQDIIRKMDAYYGPEQSVQEWRAYMRLKKHELEYSFIRDPNFKKEGLDELLSFLQSKRIKVAVASSSASEVIHRFLTVSDTLPFIDLYVSGEEVSKGKPSPDIFFEVCTRLKVNPKEALVLEDSPAGVQAAYHAGIPAFFIPDFVKETSIIRKLKPKVFENLAEVEQYLRLL